MCVLYNTHRLHNKIKKKEEKKGGNVTYAQERHIYIQIVEPKQGYIRIVDIKQTPKNGNVTYAQERHIYIYKLLNQNKVIYV